MTPANQVFHVASDTWRRNASAQSIHRPSRSVTRSHLSKANTKIHNHIHTLWTSVGTALSRLLLPAPWQLTRRPKPRGSEAFGRAVARAAPDRSTRFQAERKGRMEQGNVTVVACTLRVVRHL